MRAKSVDLPNISIEMILPTEALPRERPAYGESLVLDTNESFASVLHISRLPGGQPLPDGGAAHVLFALSVRPEARPGAQPARLLNMEAPWPVTDDTPVAEALPVELAGHRRGGGGEKLRASRAVGGASRGRNRHSVTRASTRKPARSSAGRTCRWRARPACRHGRATGAGAPAHAGGGN